MNHPMHASFSLSPSLPHPLSPVTLYTLCLHPVTSTSPTPLQLTPLSRFCHSVYTLLSPASVPHLLLFPHCRHLITLATHHHLPLSSLCLPSVTRYTLFVSIPSQWHPSLLTLYLSFPSCLLSTSSSHLFLLTLPCLNTSSFPFNLPHLNLSI